MSALQVIEPKPLSDGAIRLFYGSDRYQFGDLRLPHGSGLFPTIIVIHGGFWKAKYSLDLMNPLCDDLTARGFATWNIEYRRVEADSVAGNPGGGWPGTFLDVANAADYLRHLALQYPLDLTRAVSLGHSAGGHLALWLAARHNLPPASPLTTATPPLALIGVVSQAGANDLDLMWQVRPQNSPVVNFLGGSPAEMPERYALASPGQLLPLGIPQILIHGDADENVPIELSRTYQVAATAAGDSVTLVELPGVEHFAVIDPGSAAWAKTLPPLLALCG